MTLGWVVGSTFLTSLIAWVGVLTLFLKEELLDRVLLMLGIKLLRQGLGT